MQVQPNASPYNLPQAGATNKVAHDGSGKVAPQQNEPLAPATTRESEKESSQSIQDATKRLQNFVSTVRSDIQFSLDDASGQTVVKVIDSQTKEVLRQIPSKEALEIAKALDTFQGLLVKQQA